MSKLHASRFGQAEQKCNRWQAVLPPEVEYKDIFDPAFWSHISSKLRPCDEITIYPDDMSWRAEVVVTEAKHLFARVVEFNFKDLTATNDAPAVEAEYAIETMWRGPHDKFSVVRVGKGGKKEVLSKGFASDDEAKRAAIDFRSTASMKAA